MTVADEILAELRALDWGTSPPSIYDAKVPDSPATRYAVLYCDPGSRAAESLCQESDSFTFRFQITSVGQTRPEAEWIAARVQTITDRRLSVTGFSLDPIRNAGSQPIRWDDRIPDRVVMYGTDQFTITGTKA